MVRVAVRVSVFLLVIAGVGAPGAAGQSGAFADVLVDDLVIGEPAQEFPGMRAVAFDPDAETVRLELDLGVLAAHGIDVGAADVELTDGAVNGATVERATVSDGRATLVFAPDDSTGDAVIEVESFRLTGLDTSGAEPATDVTYDATFSAGEARVRPFDIVDPDQVTRGWILPRSSRRRRPIRSRSRTSRPRAETSRSLWTFECSKLTASTSGRSKQTSPLPTQRWLSRTFTAGS